MANIYLGPKGIISLAEAAKMQVLVHGACPHPGYVTGFESFDEFRRWSETLPAKDRLAQALQKTEEAQAIYNQDPLAAIATQQETIKATRLKVEALAEKMGMDPNSYELFLKATVDANPIEGSIFRSAQLFEHCNRTGRRLDIRSWQWYPNLGWLGFSDIISGVRVHPWSVLVLCEHVNFGGRWTFFFGGLWWDGEYCLDREVNDTASSAFCVGF